MLEHHAFPVKQFSRFEKGHLSQPQHFFSIDPSARDCSSSLHQQRIFYK